MAMQTMSMKIAEYISTLIGKGILHPGEHLIETKIAERFKVSRAPVREALLMLERDRLVSRVPHQGVIVRNFNKDEIHNLYDVMYRLEEIATFRAAQSITDGDANVLEDILKNQAAFVQNREIEAYYDLNEQFHDVVLRASGNPLFLEIYGSLRRSARPLRLLSLGQGNNLDESLKEHRMELEALRERNPDKAVLIVKSREKRSLSYLDLLFPEYGEGRF